MIQFIDVQEKKDILNKKILFFDEMIETINNSISEENSLDIPNELVLNSLNNQKIDALNKKNALINIIDNL